MALNLVNVTTISAKTVGQAVSTSATAIVSNATSSGKIVKCNFLMCGNTDTTTAYNVTVDVYNGTTAYRIGPTMVVPPNATLDIISKPLYLEEGQSLRLTASTANKLEAVVSYEELS